MKAKAHGATEFLENAGTKIFNSANEASEKTKEILTATSLKMEAGLIVVKKKTHEALQDLKVFIGTSDEAHNFTFDKYLKRGYRVNHNSFYKMLCSLFTCHNETVNICSHLIGAICFIFALFVLCYVKTSF